MGFPLNYSKLTSFIKKNNILEQEKRKRNADDIITPHISEMPSTVNKELTTSWFFSFIQSITNNMPNLPSDHINEIVEVDFPTELGVSTFYQLLGQMTLLGSTIFHKCTIVRLLSFTEWNRKYSFADNKSILISLSDSEQFDIKEVEPAEALDELFKEQFIDDNGICSSSSSQITQQHKKPMTLEIVVQLQYLSPQSELFSKMVHYFSTTIFLRPISYGRYVTRMTIPIPSISTIEPILTWLYNHDDKAWMDTITSRNFEQVCQNVIFLGLGDEAFSVLERKKIVLLLGKRAMKLYI
ncbi:11857_t:CDS:2 [Rhizophagus irregularis]|nr:11857_t:CDS:2 [Rhizophagus irregularis]